MDLGHGGNGPVKEVEMKVEPIKLPQPKRPVRKIYSKPNNSADFLGELFDNEMHLGADENPYYQPLKEEEEEYWKTLPRTGIITLKVLDSRAVCLFLTQLLQEARSKQFKLLMLDSELEALQEEKENLQNHLTVVRMNDLFQVFQRNQVG